MEAEGDSGKSVGEQSQVLPGPGITDSRGTKNPRRDQALLRELRKEKELKDEERELVKEREQMESTDMPEHQRLDLSSPDCSSIKQSRNLLDRIERNAQRQLAVADEIRRLSEQMRTVKARSMQANEGEQKMETAALDEHGDAANGGEHKMETDAFNEHDAGGDAANGGEQKMETDALGEHDDDSDAANGGEQKMETAALDEHGVDGGAANGREQKMETAALDEHDVDGGGDEEQMDCDNSSMEEQVPRIDSKPTSEAEAEAATGLDTNESAIESNISVSVSDKSILKPAATNRGDDVVEKMDRGKSPEQLDIETKKMAAEQEEFAQYVDAWDDKWGSNGFGFFQYMTTLSSMQCTHLIPGSTPRQYCQVAPSLQIFSIKLAEIGGGLQWPLPVYGVVAARDHVDHNRNLLFACYRSNCQILKEEDPFLTLIGPSRAIVCKESVDFEIQLKVRGTTESEDRALITGVCTYNRGDSTVCFTNCFCTAEFRLEVLQETVQATVLGVRVKDGSWPSGWGGRVACSVIDGEIDATPGEVELLVSRRSAMPVTSEGYLLLSRNVVSVDVNRRLNFLLEAYLPSGDTIAQKELSFKPKLCNISQDSCELHGIELEITVAWSSLVSEKQDISVQGCVGDEEQMDWDIASMEEQVPRIDSKLTSEVGPEAETESAAGLDTSESANESNTSMFVSDKSILEPADSVATNTGYDVEKMDRGKSDEQLKIEAKKMAAEQKSFAMYVDAWEGWGSDGFGCFRDMTTVSSMQYTHLIPGSTPMHYGRVAPSLQIFSVKFAEIRGGLEWPLPVYGTVAARDHVDHNRNLLFARNRSECQILNEQDPFLTLTGPSRAIVSEESVVFEIQLKVRGRTKSQDKPLINGVCTYNRGEGPICFRNCFCTIELSLEVLRKTVQATILGIRVKEEGSWPKGFGGRVACSVIGPDARPEEVELLVSRYIPMPMTSEGYLLLSRNVVSVDFCGSLNFVLEAYSDSGDKAAQGNVSFEPKFCNISQETCKLTGGIELEITVAWSSLVSEKWDIWVQGCAF